MTHWTRSRWVAGALLLVPLVLLPRCVTAQTARPAPPAAPPDGLETRVKLTDGLPKLEFSCAGAVTIKGNEGSTTLAAGDYTVTAHDAKPARQRFHLFVKTFPPREAAEAEAYRAQWRAQGFDPVIVVFGKRFQARSGAEIDNRSLWVSVARCATLQEANNLKARLEKQKVWGWTLPETAEPGRALLVVADARGQRVARAHVPLRLRGQKPLRLANIDAGFWSAQKGTREYGGTIEIIVGPNGLMEPHEILPVEDYLRGVLPAEMPASWPAEALKAQAVAARSEVYAALAGKHMLEGYDFCGTEHCRAYLGCGGGQPSTDSAVRDTQGTVLTHAGRIVPTVFSANCGGWTENNETVWSGPANPVLRGVPDLPGNAGRAGGTGSIRDWLLKPPRAYCSVNPDSFRWKKRLTTAELTALVNKRHAVGTVRSVEPGSRGVSGRLKSVTVSGSKKTEVITKELNIRLAFGGLPSAMFVVESEGPPGRPTGFVFTGGGRGHGVGLCQDGARGMAQAGADCVAILEHYFPQAQLARLP